MNELKGSEFTLEVEDPITPGEYKILGGLKTKTASLNGEAVDVTNHGSNGWRQLLDGAGINSIDLSGEGVTTKVDVLKHVLEFWKNRKHMNFRIKMLMGTENVLQIDMISKIVSVEFSGENDKEVPYSISLQSAEQPDMQIF